MKLGFIGTGNMGGAIVRAAAKAVGGQDIYICNRTLAKSQALSQEVGCQIADGEEIAANCDYVFLGVKPQGMKELLSRISPILQARKIPVVLISMAAGLSMQTIQSFAGGEYPVIRMMPNTPVAVGSGVILYDATSQVTDGQLSDFLKAMSHGGLCDRLTEKLIDAGSAVAGCGPAFGAMFLEALADGAVACGLPREKALTYAGQMLLGTAKLALETGVHPAQLKDAVCSPGGSTIAGVAALEQGGLRSATIDAVKKAYQRTKELGKQ